MPTSPQRETAADTKPALTLAIHRMPSRNWDANVFKVHQQCSAFVHSLLLFFTCGFTFDYFLPVTLLLQFRAIISSCVAYNCTVCHGEHLK